MRNRRRLMQITDRIWMLMGSNRQVQPNVGIIVNQKETILVDCGNSPARGELIQEYLDLMKAPPVTHIIYTHHHWDHVFGAMAFGATVAAHEKCLDYLEKEAKKPWGSDYLKTAMKHDPKGKKSHEAKLKAINNWHQFHIVLPQITFKDSLALEFSGSRLYLEHAGGDHSDDCILVYDEEDQVLFAGDAFYPPPYHKRSSGFMGKGFSKDVLRKIASHQVRFVVHGHGLPLTLSELLWELNLPEVEERR